MSQVSSAKAPVPQARQKMERLLSVDEVAEFLGIPVATLYQWRHKGAGPEAYRVGRHLRYEPAAVRAWLAEHLTDRHGPR
jgi:excisionase family DNA binding protein